MLRGEPSWHTSSTGPTSMPSSSEAVATTARSSPGAQPGLDPQPAVHGQAPVVGLHAVVAEPVGQLVGDTLGHPPGVHEHERRAVLLDVAGDALEHRRHLLVGRHGAELVVGQLDGDVEAPLVPDVDDRAEWLAVRQAAVLRRRRRAAGRWSRSAAGWPTGRCADRRCGVSPASATSGRGAPG